MPRFAEALPARAPEKVPTTRTQIKGEFNVIIEKDAAGNDVASVPSLRGCHTQGTSLDQVIDRIREAIQLCLEEGGTQTEALDVVGIQKITVRS